MADKTFFEKYIEIQRELKAPKNQKNTFGNYNYRSCEDILEAVKPLAHERGLAIRIKDHITTVGDRVYVEAMAILTDGENNIAATAYAREEETKKGMDASQITGSASSYARKYALNGLFAIDDTKDADTQDNTTKPKASGSGQPEKQTTSQGEKLTDKQLKLLEVRRSERTLSVDQLNKLSHKMFGVEDYKTLTKVQASKLIDEL